MVKMHFRRALAAGSAVVCISAFAAWPATAGARAAEVVRCAGDATLQIRPGLTTTDNQDVTVVGPGKLYACTGPGGATGLTAEHFVAGGVRGSCSAATTTQTQLFRWSDGTESSVQLEGSVSPSAGRLTGVVFFGRFDGAKVSMPNVIAAAVRANPSICTRPDGLTLAHGTGIEYFTLTS
jgi:hypothetical protein